MRYISVFRGVEAASVAWEPLGWEPVAFCEVDEFPSAVLAYRFPNVPNLGDITKVDWSEFADGSVDIVIGGSPCQSFSVAGKREGLAGVSGALMFEYIRCVREVRPRYFVWENVPGAFSSEKGEAFRQLLAEMDDLGYGLAWRVLDAQFFGVAQRRRRVFLVGSLGNQRAAEILFEPDGLRWDHPSSREKRQELTRTAQQRAEEGCGDGCLTPWDIQSMRVYAREGAWPTLYAGADTSGLQRQSVLTTAPTYCFQQNTRDEVRYINGDGSIAGALAASSGAKQTNYVLTAPTYCIDGSIARGARFNQNGKGWSDTGECYTLNTIDIPAVATPSVLAFNTTCITSPTNGNKPQWGDPCHCLAAQDHPPTIVIDRAAFNQGENALYDPHIEATDVMDTLVARGPHAVCVTQYGEEIADTLTARHDSSPCVDRGQNVVCMASGQANAEIEVDMAPAQAARQYKDPQIVCYRVGETHGA